MIVLVMLIVIPLLEVGAYDNGRGYLLELVHTTAATEYSGGTSLSNQLAGQGGLKTAIKALEGQVITGMKL